MLTLIFLVIGILLSTWTTPTTKIWNLTISNSSFIFLYSTLLISPTSLNSNINWGLNNDTISTPLIILSFWLLPVSLLASIGHLQNNSNKNKRIFITLCTFILLALIITFSASNLLLFFIGFESTLIPTLLLISRWGMQQERIEAGYYFVFYTLTSSLPLLLAIITLYNTNHHLNIPLWLFFNNINTNYLLAIFCIVAFLVKVPVFSLHLWLPKAHVEAPVAGSMILAAILLKMGGYGFIRLAWIFSNSFQEKLNYFIIPFCCWGGALTSIICLTQTDLKSLIAYSSVSHMSFMIAGISMITLWGTSGSIIVMIAHGLVASALFCIANLFYERSGTRTLIVSRGIKLVLSIIPLFWLIFACANLGLPPSPNSMGELLIFSSIFSHQLINILPTIIGIIFTGTFSLIIYQYLNTGSFFPWNIWNTNTNERETLTLSLHTLPLLSLILTPTSMSL